MLEPNRTLAVWSAYVLLIGAELLLIPNQTLDILGLDSSSEIWPRVVGVVAMALGIVYAMAAREHNIAVARYSVPARVVAAPAFVVLWLTGGPWQMVIFGAVDGAGAAWTWSALRASRIPVMAPR